jgi:hypothetical protein
VYFLVRCISQTLAGSASSLQVWRVLARALKALYVRLHEAALLGKQLFWK